MVRSSIGEILWISVDLVPLPGGPFTCSPGQPVKDGDDGDDGDWENAMGAMV